MSKKLVVFLLLAIVLAVPASTWATVHYVQIMDIEEDPCVGYTVTITVWDDVLQVWSPQFLETDQTGNSFTDDIDVGDAESWHFEVTDVRYIEGDEREGWRDYPYVAELLHTD